MNNKKIVIGAMIVIGTVFAYKKIRNKKSEKREVQEKVLHVEVNRQIVTLDPTMAEDLTSTVEISKVYEGLFEYAYLKRPAELVPNLAESMPEISKDGLVYTFKIRRGIFFQDNSCFLDGKGKELKAQDFVYSIKRLADPKIQCPLFSFVDGRIKGLNEWRDVNSKRANTDYDEIIEGVQAIDDYTLQVVLNSPWPQFLYILCMPSFYAIAREAVDFYGREFLNHPVGTGPYVIDNFNPQENKLIAIRNPKFRAKYYPTDASEECKDMLIGSGVRVPFIDKIVTSVIVEDQTKWLQFLKGDLDILDLQGCPDIGQKIKDDKPIEELSEKGIFLIKRSFAHTSMYCVNCEDPIMKNIYLRQAISLAYDRNRENYLFNNGLYQVANSIIPPGLAGYDKNFINPYVQNNIEEAKKLLAKAGYPDGRGLDPITLDIKQGALERQQAEYFQKSMEAIGLKIVICVNSWSELLKKAQTKQTQIFKMNWYGDYPDAENFLALFYKTDLIGGVYTNYKNLEFDNLFVEANRAKSSSDREFFYKKMNEIIAYDLPILPQVHASKLIMVYDYILHYDYLDFKFNMFEYIDIDMIKKKGASKK